MAVKTERERERVLLLLVHQHKAAGVKTKQGVKKNNDRHGFSLVFIVLRKETAFPAEGLEQALKQEKNFSGILGDDCAACANLLEFKWPCHLMCLLSFAFKNASK